MASQDLPWASSYFQSIRLLIRANPSLDHILHHPVAHLFALSLLAGGMYDLQNVINALFVWLLLVQPLNMSPPGGMETQDGLTCASSMFPALWYVYLVTGVNDISHQPVVCLPLLPFLQLLRSPLTPQQPSHLRTSVRLRASHRRQYLPHLLPQSLLHSLRPSVPQVRPVTALQRPQPTARNRLHSQSTLIQALVRACRRASRPPSPLPVASKSSR
jgi:hypothetical protein